MDTRVETAQPRSGVDRAALRAELAQMDPLDFFAGPECSNADGRYSKRGGCLAFARGAYR